MLIYSSICISYLFANYCDLECTWEQCKYINENLAPTHIFIYSALCQDLNQNQNQIKDQKLKSNN